MLKRQYLTKTPKLLGSPSRADSEAERLFLHKNLFLHTQRLEHPAQALS